MGKWSLQKCNIGVYGNRCPGASPPVGVVSAFRAENNASEPRSVVFYILQVIVECSPASLSGGKLRLAS